MIPLLWAAVPLVGWAIVRARRASPAAAAAVDVPPYDADLPSSTARAVDVAVGRGRNAAGALLPGDVSAPRVRTFAKLLAPYPVARAALERYAATL